MQGELFFGYHGDIGARVADIDGRVELFIQGKSILQPAASAPIDTDPQSRLRLQALGLNDPDDFVPGCFGQCDRHRFALS